MDWLDLLAVQGTLKSLLQHHSSKASVLLHSAFFIVQLAHPYMTTGESISPVHQYKPVRQVFCTVCPKDGCKVCLFSYLAPVCLVFEHSDSTVGTGNTVVNNRHCLCHGLSRQSAHHDHEGGTSLTAQWLRLHAPNARHAGLIPGQGVRSHML